MLFIFTSAVPVVSQIKEPLPSHPRLFLLKGEEPSVRAAVHSNEILSRVHSAVIAEADAVIKLPPLERKLTGRRLLSVSRDAIQRIFILSYAFRMTSDEKYASAAEKELLNISSFSDWHPEHFLDVAEMTTAAAIGYDWLYDFLPAKSRSVVREAILKKGIEPSWDKRFNGWLKAVHNWNQVCNAGVTLGAIAVYEDDPQLAKKTIERAAESIKLPMHEYEPEGAFPEGYGYWGYGTTYNVLFIDAVKKALSTDFGLLKNSNFLKTAGFMENMTGTSGKAFNFSDSGSSGVISPAMFWFASSLKDESLLYVEKNYLSAKKISVRDRFLPMLLVWSRNLNLDKVKEPAKLIWTGQGRTPVALMRSSWKKEGIYVAFKGGSSSTNHSHMDAGSFVMDALGERWAMDFGMQEYNSLESKGVDLWNMKQTSQRWKVFRYANNAHNTLMFDNAFQRVNGFAKIDSYSDDLRFLSAQSDLSSVYSGQVSLSKRGVAIVDSSYVVIRDEISTLENAADVRWTMVTPADVAIQPDGSAVLTQKGKTLLMKIAEPAGLKLERRDTNPPHDYDEPNPGTSIVCFSAGIPAQSKKSFTVVLVPQGSEGRVKPVVPLDKWKTRK